MTIDDGDCRVVSEVFSFASGRFTEDAAIHLAAEALRARHLSASLSEAVSATMSILFGAGGLPCS
ncbi:hypothetical protein [Azospirillum rugosum]|uniref:Uncharacterized protein n=1 Tax=Azospirillum rugosum TaxID=416170 RepID=A0ABS4SFJ7_9PROT|nr:hypothetical protein [Azospirillum rugosum]MBP2290843.1 hypothetical protein [Azospirillum rugosum]MDQ0529710.1 hypothetical protein [Azospirillum rugosum]